MRDGAKSDETKAVTQSEVGVRQNETREVN